MNADVGGGPDGGVLAGGPEGGPDGGPDGGASLTDGDVSEWAFTAGAVLAGLVGGASCTLFP